MLLQHQRWSYRARIAPLQRFGFSKERILHSVWYEIYLMFLELKDEWKLKMLGPLRKADRLY